MALIKCKECGTSVSDKASVCVHCGAPIGRSKRSAAPKKKAGIFTSLAAFVLVAWIVTSCQQPSHKTPATPKPSVKREEKKKCSSDDLQCLAQAGLIGANVYCVDAVERRALHSVKWVDGFLEMKFDRFSWVDKDKGVIGYFGDKAEFQNGFGAYTRMIYECDLASDNETVLRVVVQEGRLP